MWLWCINIDHINRTGKTPTVFRTLLRLAVRLTLSLSPIIVARPSPGDRLYPVDPACIISFPLIRVPLPSSAPFLPSSRSPHHHAAFYRIYRLIGSRWPRPSLAVSRRPHRLQPQCQSGCDPTDRVQGDSTKYHLYTFSRKLAGSSRIYRSIGQVRRWRSFQ